ncbi:MAG: hypothetical protein HY326_05585 [Chloroflexi bacterium]|nr:hypothetical protein [Chloroflexota bacterium]
MEKSYPGQQVAAPSSSVSSFITHAPGPVVAIARILIGYLWYNQLLWKIPWQNFGCPPDLSFSADFNQRTSGLCDWIGLEIAYPRSDLYHAFLVSFVKPNIALIGWGTWLLELAITATLILGLFTRLGGILGALQGLNLFIGLTAIPYEWDWAYAMLIIINAVLAYTAAGRCLGIDYFLRPALATAAQKNPIARIALAFT